MSNILTCEQLEPLLSAHYDGELSESERANVDKHLADCQACQTRLMEVAAVAATLKALPTLSPKTDIAENIGLLIAAQPTAITAIRKPLAWSAFGIAAAAAGVIVVGNFTMVNVKLTAQSGVNKSTYKQPQGATKTQGIEVADAVDANASPRDSGANSVQQNKPEVGAPVQNVKPTNENHAKKNGKYNPRVEVADRGTGGTDSVPGTASDQIDQSQNSGDGEPVASNSKNGGTTESVPDSNLVAVYETDQHNVTEELGITTDEDGLYAIKL
jgi:Putative zinc-finger